VGHGFLVNSLVDIVGAVETQYDLTAVQIQSITANSFTYNVAAGTPATATTLSAITAKVTTATAVATASPGAVTKAIGNTLVTFNCVNHGFITGTSVVISGANEPGFNGTFAVASTPSLDSFTYTAPVAGTAIAVAIVGGYSRVGTVGTFVSAAPHNLVANTFNQVTITGATDPAYNGTFVVQSTPNSTTFTVNLLSVPAASPATVPVGSTVLIKATALNATGTITARASITADIRVFGDVQKA
jgi:hypothetical protein